MTITAGGDALEDLLAEWIPSEADLAELDEQDRKELLYYLSRRMNDWSFYKPPDRINEKALLAEALLPKVDWMVAGGAAGGGKSELGLKHALDLSQRYENHASLVLRTSKPELQRSIVMRSIARFMQLDVKARLRTIDNVKAWAFPNTSSIEFGYCSRLEDVGQYLSAEYQFLWMDESTQFLQQIILSIAARLRTTVGTGIRPHALLTTNPGDKSHAFHKDVAIDPTARGQFIVVYDVEEGLEKLNVVRRIPCPQDWREAQAMEPIVTDPERELVVAFVPFKSTDNPYLERRYRAALSALPEIERKQKRDGDWDTFSGQFFAEFDPAVHVIDPFDIPEGWARGRGLDWGWRAPFCCLWGAWDQDGNCYVYREKYGAKLTTQEQAAEVGRLSKRQLENGTFANERYVGTTADPAVFNTTGAGDSVAVQWQRAGLYVKRANNDRRSGWGNLRDYLRLDQQTNRPRLFIMRNCHDLIRTIPLQQYAKESEDLDTDLEDHAVDALRYLLMQRPITRSATKRKFRDGLEGSFDRLLAEFDRSTRRTRGRLR